MFYAISPMPIEEKEPTRLLSTTPIVRTTLTGDVKSHCSRNSFTKGQSGHFQFFSISLLSLALPCLLTWEHPTVPSSCIMIMAKSSTQPCTLNRCRSHLPSDPFHLPWNMASIHGGKSIDCHPSAISEELPSPLVILFLGLRKTYRLRTRDHFGPVIMKYFLSSLGLGWILKA